MRPRLSILFVLLLCSIPRLAAAQAGGSIVFLGTEVTPLGAATLSLGPSLAARSSPMTNNRLYVGNLSFNSDNGFSMLIGGGSGAWVGFTDTAPTFPAGGTMTLRGRGIASEGPTVAISVASGGITHIAPDFTSLGASSYRVEVWNDDEPVAWSDGGSGMLTAASFPIAFAIDLESVIAPLPDPYPLPATSAFDLSDGFLFRWGSNVTFTNSVGMVLGTGDELRLYPNGPIHLQSLETLDVVVQVPAASSPYTMVVDDMAQQMSGRKHRGKNGSIVAADFDGKAKMTIPAGVSGGMQFDMDPSQTGDKIIWSYQDGFVAGDTDEYSVTAELLAGGQAVVGRVFSLHNGAQWNVTLDFSGSGSPDARVELFDATDHLLASAPHVTGFSIMTNQWAVETGVEDGADLALQLGFRTPVVVAIPGGGITTAQIIKVHSNSSKNYRFFAIVDRTQLSAAGGGFTALAEPNTHVINVGSAGAFLHGGGRATGKRCHKAFLIENNGGPADGLDVKPCASPCALPPDQFGVEWVPLGPPSAQTGQTDWSFITKLATDSAPVERMAIRLVSDGSMVNVSVARQTPKTDFGSVMKKGGVVVVEHEYTQLNTVIAQLSDWPIAIGYQVLYGEDEPWAIWIDLGYEMDVADVPPDPVRSRAAAHSLTKADLIEIIAKNTTNPGPPQQTMLSARLTGVSHMVILDRDPTPTAITAKPAAVRSVLRPAYPNPFNPQTTLSFDLASRGHVALKIYAVDGSYVATVHVGVLGAGPHTYSWNGVDHRGNAVASGVYLVELRTPDGVLHTKLNLLK